MGPPSPPGRGLLLLQPARGGGLGALLSPGRASASRESSRLWWSYGRVSLGDDGWLGDASVGLQLGEVESDVDELAHDV